MPGLFPEGFTEREVLRRRFGSLSFATSDDPPAFWIVAQGAISPSLIREELPVVERFGREHANGWTYVVDTTRVWFIHPYNPLLLRKIRTLPNNRRYVVLAPPFVRFLGWLVSWLIRPTHSVGSVAEALAIAASPLVSDSGKQ